MLPQMCSIGFKSGDCGGQIIVSISWFKNHSFTSLCQWYLAPSCIKITLLPGNFCLVFSIKGNKLFSRTSKYNWWFMVAPCGKTYKSLVPAPEKAPQIPTFLRLPGTVGRVITKLFPFLLVQFWIHWGCFLVEKPISKLLSSDHTTVAQSKVV